MNQFWCSKVGKMVEELREELDVMQTLLQDAEERQQIDDCAKNWLAAVKDVVSDVEDVVDEWSFRRLAEKKVGFFGGTCFSSFRKSKLVKEIGQCLQILTQLKKEGTDCLGLGHRSIEQGFFHLGEEAPKKIKVQQSEPVIYGRDDEKQTIAGKLLAKDSDASVVAIWGVAGIGKTISAPTIYKELDSLHKLLPRDFDLKDSLMLSYLQLPVHLKQCLSYCFIFPRGYPIDVDNLIKLWMAQGYLGSNEIEMERRGLLYFKELVQRSFFCEYTLDDLGYTKCKLKGLVSDLIRFLAENDCHSFRIEHKIEVDHFFTKARHWTINVGSHAPLPVSVGRSEKLRTLVFLSDFTSADSTTIRNILSQTRRLRALDLSHCSFGKLPLKVSKLIHLRYLNLSFNLGIKELHESVCGLANLQTLILNGCENLRKLPTGIGRLKLLRHLEILWTPNLLFLPKEIASLTSLRTLNRFICGIGSQACNLADLKPINQLQHYMSIDALGIVSDVFIAKEANLKNKKHLISLDLWFTRVEPEYRNDDSVLEALGVPPNLEKLQIFYYGGSLFPCWMTELENLRHLVLSDCCKCEKLPALGNLPLLESLEIKHMAQVRKVGFELLGIESNGGKAEKETSELQIDVEAGGNIKRVMLAMGLNIGNGVRPDSGLDGPDSNIVFPKLEKLHFENLSSWEEWDDISDRGKYVTVMPLLSLLSIVNCRKITAVPNYVRRKENLSILIEKCPHLKVKNLKGRQNWMGNEDMVIDNQLNSATEKRYRCQL